MSWLSRTPDILAEDEAERRFSELANAHVHTWLALAREIVWDAHHAEDAVAEALTALAQALASDDPPHNPIAWMTTAIANRAHERLRNERSQRRIIERLERLSSDPGGTTAADSAEERKARLQQIAEQLPQLTERQREVVTLFLAEGLSHREIAERLGCAESSIRVTYHNAVVRLKGLVEAGGGGFPENKLPDTT